MSFAKTLYDFNPDQDNQLRFRANETLAVFNKVNETWWEAENTSFQKGLVPSTYLQEIELPVEIKELEIGERENMTVKATRAYSLPKSTHLTLEEGDMINVLEICSHRWWIGELKKDTNIIGVFPSAFVQIVQSGYRIDRSSLTSRASVGIGYGQEKDISPSTKSKSSSKDSMKKNKKDKRMSVRINTTRDVERLKEGVLRKELDLIESEDLNQIWSKLFSLFIAKQGLDVKGAFIQIGDQNDITKFQEVFNGGVNAILHLGNNDITNVHSITTFIKLWISFLPEPVCTSMYSEEFITSEFIDNDELRRSKIQTLIYLLPPNHRSMLDSLLSFVISIKATQTDKNYLEELCSSLLIIFDKKVYQKRTHYKVGKYGVKTIMFMIEKYTELFKTLSSATIKFGINKDSKNIEVIAANKSELFTKISDPLYGNEKGLDTDYVAAFLTTYDYFSTDIEVLAFLSKVYFQYMDNNEDWGKNIRINIITVLKVWMNKYLYGEFGEKTYSDEFQERYNLFISSMTDNLYKNLLNSVDFKSTMKKKFSLKSYKYYKLPTEKTEKIQTILNAKNVEKIRDAITAINEEIWFNIEPVELLHKNFESAVKAPQLNALINLFNKFQEWGAAQVMLAANPNVRLEMMCLVIKLSYALRQTNNFNASFALFAGLNLPAVSRLKKLWESLEKQKIYSKYLELKELYSPSGNHKNYQDALRSCEPPVIPYIGLYNKYLFTIEETNKTMTEEGLINFQKLRMLYRLIGEIQSYQKKKYDITPDPQFVESVCKDLRLDWDENKLYEISLKIRPRDMK